MDLAIPEEVRINAQKGLDLYKKHGRGGSATALATARFLLKNSIATYQKVRQMTKHFKNHFRAPLGQMGQTKTVRGFWLFALRIVKAAFSACRIPMACVGRPVS